MNVRVSKRGDGAVLELGVEDMHVCQSGEDNVRMHTEAMETRCPVALGAATKVLLTENADGSPRTWVEVTVKEAKYETHSAATCPAGKSCDDGGDSPAAGFAQCVNDIMCSVADMASDLFGAETWSEPAELPPPQYVQHPPQYNAPDPVYPLVRELAAQEAGTCPAAGCSQPASAPCSNVCTQCAATAPAQPAMRVCIDASKERKCVEMTLGKKRFKATADHVTMHDDCITLEGDVRAESCDDSCCDVIKTDKMRVEQKGGGLTIHMDCVQTNHQDK
jgi:hypothetical protein